VLHGNKLDAVLAHRTLLDGAADSKPVEQGQILRQQRLANVKTRMPVLLGQNHAVAAFRQQRGAG
jgi:hypothetical protein